MIRLLMRQQADMNNNLRADRSGEILCHKTINSFHLKMAFVFYSTALFSSFLKFYFPCVLRSTAKRERIPYARLVTRH